MISTSEFQTRSNPNQELALTKLYIDTLIAVFILYSKKLKITFHKNGKQTLSLSLPPSPLPPHLKSWHREFNGVVTTGIKTSNLWGVMWKCYLIKCCLNTPFGKTESDPLIKYQFHCSGINLAFLSKWIDR